MSFCLMSAKDHAEHCPDLPAIDSVEIPHELSQRGRGEPLFHCYSCGAVVWSNAGERYPYCSVECAVEGLQAATASLEAQRKPK